MMTRYIVEITEDGDDVNVSVTGKNGLTPSDLVQVFGFCLTTLIEHGAQPADLKAIIDQFYRSCGEKIE